MPFFDNSRKTIAFFAAGWYNEAYSIILFTKGTAVMLPLRIDPTHRYFQQTDGTPFHWIGDTAWELLHALNRKETAWYLTTRTSQKFTVIQTVVLAECDGLRTPNAYGRLPLKRNDAGRFDPTKPDCDGEYSYFDHVEYVLSTAEALGLYVALLPTWGDKWNRIGGLGPEIFSPENAFAYGKWLGARCSHHNNLLWILGGDRPVDTTQHRAILDAMAEGLHARDRGKFLIGLHPCGAASSSHFLHDAPWLDFHMTQSGHGYPTKPAYELTIADYHRTPIRPVVDGEICYEDHPKNFDAANGYFDDTDVRQTVYRNLFSGAGGCTYGHSSVWRFQTETDDYWPNPWKTAIHRPAAAKMYLYHDFLSRHNLRAHTPVTDAVLGNTPGEQYVPAMVSPDSAYLYIPNGAPITLHRAVVPFTKAILYNPRSGKYTDPMPLYDRIRFSVGGRGMDVIVIAYDNAAKI